jgi:hypothetical protein
LGAATADTVTASAAPLCQSLALALVQLRLTAPFSALAVVLRWLLPRVQAVTVSASPSRAPLVLV